MKPTLALTVLSIFVSSLAWGQAKTTTAPKPAGVEETLMQIERDWATALVKADVAAIDRIEAADYVYTDPSGQMMSKAQGLAELKSGQDKFQSFTIDDMKVRVYGDTAIVHGMSTSKETYKGKDISGQYRWTDVFIKQGGRWQALTTHSSKVAK